MTSEETKSVKGSEIFLAVVLVVMTLAQIAQYKREGCFTVFGEMPDYCGPWALEFLILVIVAELAYPLSLSIKAFKSRNKT